MLGVYNYTVILTYIGMLTGLAGIGLLQERIKTRHDGREFLELSIGR